MKLSGTSGLKFNFSADISYNFYFCIYGKYLFPFVIHILQYGNIIVGSIFCSNLQVPTPISSLSKSKRSPSRRSKSRWEPLPVEKPAEAPPPHSNGAAAKYGGWANVSEREKKVKVHSLLAYGVL